MPAGEASYAGFHCAVLSNPAGHTLYVTVDRGPRVIGYEVASGVNAFVALDGLGLDSPGGRFEFMGGHRLWLAPETPGVTHLPDEEACTVELSGNNLHVTAPDNGSGYTRSIRVESFSDGFIVDHTVTGTQATSARPVASWAITQLPLGGSAIVPFGPGPDPGDFQASHSLVLWPYTKLDDPRISVEDGYVLIEAVAGNPCKIGVRPDAGSMGYFRDGLLFSKRTDPAPDPIPDLGASAQVYSGPDFVELETVSTLRELSPGQTTGHREVWRVRESITMQTAIGEVLEPA